MGLQNFFVVVQEDEQCGWANLFWMSVVDGVVSMSCDHIFYIITYILLRNGALRHVGSSYHRHPCPRITGFC